MADCYIHAVLRDRQVIVGFAHTTLSCRTAQERQKLRSTSTVALGRLLTAAVMMAFVRKREGGLSLQVVGGGRLGQIFADIELDGSVRGFIKNGELALPVLKDQEPEARRYIGPGVGQGTLTLVQLGPPGAGRQAHSHSTTALVSGEIDTDVEHYATASEQVPTVLAADVVLDERNQVVTAGGFIAQVLPMGDVGHLQSLAEAVKDGGLATLLRQHPQAPETILKQLCPEAQTLDTQKVAWRCRCSKERVQAALATLDSATLADMVEKQEGTSLRCNFCGQEYAMSPDDIASLYQGRLAGEA